MMSKKIPTQLLFVLILTAALLGLVWGLAPALFPAPAQANIAFDSTAVQQPPARPLATGLSLSQSAPTTIINGDWITYTLTIANDGTDVKEIYVEDQLPQDVLANAQCLTEVNNCEVEVSTTTVNIRGGGTVIVTQPIKVKWTFTSTTALTHSFPLTLQFKAQVLCQPVGSQFDNQASLNYTNVNGQLGFALADPLQLTTEVAQAPFDQQGHFYVSSAPELCTTNGPVGGTSDMDWGDFDNDGDLDLVLVSWGDGVFVYRNNGQGQFKMFWNGSNHPAESVQWADFDGKADGYLELVVGGEFSGNNSPLPDGSGTYPFSGKNYLYRFNGSDAFEEYDQFETNDGVWRLAAADFSGDGYPDLAMLNYWGGCTAHLYLNQSGVFTRTDPANTTGSYCLFGPPYDTAANGTFGAHSAAWGDVDDDGDPDLAVGHYDPLTRTLRIYSNNAGTLVDTNYIDVDTASLVFLSNFRYVYDLAWGDYDSDGDLDLAAAFASGDRYYSSVLGGGWRVYRNDGGSFSQAYSLATIGPVGSLDWADFDGDGEVELIIAEYGATPKIYKYRSGTFSLLQSLNITGRGAVMGIRGIDADNEGDLDIAVANFLAESWIFSNNAPFLQQFARGLVPSFVSHSVAWGDVNNDGSLDLLYGTDESTKLYKYQPGSGTYFGDTPFSPNPLVRSAALGDVEGDGDLDMLLAPNGQNFLYRNDSGSFTSLPVWIAAPADNTYGQFFADINQDNLGRPDLVVGNNGNPNRLYINQGSTLATDPAWESPQAGSTYNVAWGYFNDDILPDLAAADGDEGVRVYRNTAFNGFGLVQTLPVSAARSAAWGDYDNDGDMDLAVGRYNYPNLLYQNTGGTLTLVWTAPTTRNTTSVAWGDWNNDGDLDLAAGNFNQKDQVYDNLGSTISQVNLVWLWEAAKNYNTTALRWIDYDHDGDLDLSLSQNSVNDPNGIYENSSAISAHQIADFADRVRLPRVSSYVSIQQPGNPGQVFRRTDRAISSTLTVPLTILAFDPDTSRQFNSNLTGNHLKITRYQYSLDGGSRWYNATVTPTLSVITPSRRGLTYTTQWLAGPDLTTNNPNQAVSDDVRLRITVSQQNTPQLAHQIAGPTQRVAAGATSPPFRVRNTSCLWPQGASTTVVQPSSSITVGTKLRFWGAVQEWGPDVITYTWDFGGSTAQGEFVDHTFSSTGTKTITMTVSQPPCPNTRLDFAITSLWVTGTVNSTLNGSNTVYLPLVMNSGASSTAQPAPSLNLASAALPQVTGLQGQVEAGDTVLAWDPVFPVTDDGGYRLYRARAGTINYQLLAELPASETTFTDKGVTCGYTYFVTAYNPTSESYPSTVSYYGPPCESSLPRSK